MGPRRNDGRAALAVSTQQPPQTRPRMTSST